MTLPLLLALPWVGYLAFLVLGVRLPRPLPPAADAIGVPAGREPGEPAEGGAAQVASGAPFVSVVIPARNEARNIERVVSSLAASDYPAFEIVVVDDRSDDGTAELAQGVDRGRAERVRVLRGEPLPGGWLGKPWACHQGAAATRGELVLFTDADTFHGRDLMGRAVAALEEDRADAVTVAGRQVMGSFWERLVQPQVFTAMLTRYWRQEAPLPRERWRDAIANGQYILIRRPVYDALGGHEALKGEVVEDLRMAQRLVRSGRRLSVRMAEDAFATRMYTSLGELVAGWSKNVVLGGLATLPEGWIRRWAPPLLLAAAVLLWLVPPGVWVAAKLGAAGQGLELWAGAVVSVSCVTWALVTARMGASAWHGLLYPLGSAVTTWIFLRAWLRGGDVEWKGRRYALEPDKVMRAP